MRRKWSVVNAAPVSIKDYTCNLKNYYCNLKNYYCNYKNDYCSLKSYYCNWRITSEICSIASVIRRISFAIWIFTGVICISTSVICRITSVIWRISFIIWIFTGTSIIRTITSIIIRVEKDRTLLTIFLLDINAFICTFLIFME
jgi:hypothetical protein